MKKVNFCYKKKVDIKIKKIISEIYNITIFY